jgi:uncharacterized protein YaiI (UPF0178 family)
MEICPAEAQAADDRLVELAEPGDAAVTRDVLLGKRLLEKGASVLDDRGREITRDNVNELLSLRDWTVGLAENGLDYKRSRTRGGREQRDFANTLDKILTRLTRQ